MLVAIDVAICEAVADWMVLVGAIVGDDDAICTSVYEVQPSNRKENTTGKIKASFTNYHLP